MTRPRAPKPRPDPARKPGETPGKPASARPNRNAWLNAALTRQLMGIADLFAQKAELAAARDRLEDERPDPAQGEVGDQAVGTPDLSQPRGRPGTLRIHTP